VKGKVETPKKQNKVRMIRALTTAILIGWLVVDCQRLDCRSDELSACVRLADPLLQANHVFPSRQEDINHVCNVLFPETWSKFVECIKQYTTSCLSQDQRSDFNRAVGDSINSVHKMCTNEDYKNDYLRHAGCIKEKSVNNEHCGVYYTNLLSMIKGDTQATQREICCTHSSFKECVIAETETCPCTGEECLQGMEATGFARAMLDKALGFLLKQCQSYTPEARDCKVYERRQAKQPRVENNQSYRDDQSPGSYFPSGVPGRDERRDDQEADWTSMNGNNPPDNSLQERTTEETQTLIQPIVRETTYTPMLDPFIPQQQQEKERRKPWIPTTDIHSFDDIFNSVENTRAQELNSAANNAIPTLAVITSVILFILF